MVNVIFCGKFFYLFVIKLLALVTDDDVHWAESTANFLQEADHVFCLFRRYGSRLSPFGE
jgi:hypothetical protein